MISDAGKQPSRHPRPKVPPLPPIPGSPPHTLKAAGLRASSPHRQLGNGASTPRRATATNSTHAGDAFTANLDRAT